MALIIKKIDKEGSVLAGFSFEELKGSILQDDRGLWEEHLRNRRRFEGSIGDQLSSLSLSSVEEAQQRGFETISAILGEFEKQGRLSFRPSHGLGHAIRDYLHAFALAKDDGDPREAFVRVVGGTLHDILGCSFTERFEENSRSLRHAEASALLFWWLRGRIGMKEEEALPVYYAISAHTNYLEEMTVVDSEGKPRKIEPYAKKYADGQPIYFLHAVQEVDRLDIIGPCGFFRHCLSTQEAIGRRFYFSPTKKFFPVDFEKHMRPFLRSAEEIGEDAFGATARELLFAMNDTQKDVSIYARDDGRKMIELRNLYREMMSRILSTFDSPCSFSISERDALFFGLNELIKQRIEPTKEAAKSICHFQELFFDLPLRTQEVWFSVFKTAMEEYEAWREIFQKEIAQIPEEMLSLPVLGRVDRIIR